ncbi:MAG: phytanoyl-CoA dioxygenase family protein [bacterium]
MDSSTATLHPATPAAIPGEAGERFLRDGFLRLDDAISDDELATLEEIYDRCFADDSLGVRRKALGGTDDAGRQTLPQVLGPSQVVPELRELDYFKQAQRIASDIFGAPAEPRSEHMILKPAGYGIATPWHQDQAYHNPTHHYRNINFWLPLDGATVEGGCMHFVRGSHLGPILPHEYLEPGNKETALVAQDQDYWSLNGTPVPCPRGSCTLHHSYMLHYAGPNTTDLPRRAYIVVFGVKPEKLDRPWQLPWMASRP